MIILKNQLHDHLNNCNWKMFFILRNVFSNVFFFFTNLSQGNFLYCLRFLIHLKTLILHVLLLNWNKTCYIDFFFVKIFVSFIKLLNISLDGTHLFLRVAYLICEMLLKVNYIPADGKSFICRAFKKSEMILFCMYVEFHIIFSIDFLHSSLTQFFFIKVF